MRIAPKNLVLTLALASLVAADVALDGPRSETRVIGRLFPGLTGDAQRIVMVPQGAGAQGRLELERDAEGAWVLPEHHGHPARARHVQAFFDRFGALTNLDLLAESPGSHARYGVGENGLLIRVLDGAGEVLAAFVQGETVTSDAGRGFASYIRPMGEDAVYRASGVSRIRTEAELWLETRFLAVQPVAVQSIRVGGAELDELAVEREDVERWRTADGQTVRARAALELLERASALFFDEVVGANAETRPLVPALELALVTKDGEQLRAVFGPAEADGSRLATKSGSRFVVRFAAEAYDLIHGAARALAP